MLLPTTTMATRQMTTDLVLILLLDVRFAACNYDPAATVNDGSCDFESCFGCLDAAACNFDGEALYGDQSQCEFPAPFLDCDGNCLSDSDGDGICDQSDSCSDLGLVTTTPCEHILSRT